MKVACIQPEVLASPEDAAAHTLTICQKAIEAGADFLALPEYCGGLTTAGTHFAPPVFPEAEHPALKAFQDFAKRTQTPMLIGSIAVSAPESDQHYLNRSIVLTAAGEISARYDKIHLFDVNLGPEAVFQESASVRPGAQGVVCQTRLGRLGLSICYDLRMPALYRSLAQAGAECLAIPAAFAQTTGEKHWHVLLRARAIECTSFVIAPCMTGPIPGGGSCYGHSLIVNPWGESLADAGPDSGYCLSDIALEEVAIARQKIPSLTHDRVFALKIY